MSEMGGILQKSIKLGIRILKIGLHVCLWVRQHRKTKIVAIYSVLVSTSVYLSSIFQTWFESAHATGQSVEGLMSFVFSVGGPFIGASAIVMSLVLFAMQINVERLPHGLFRRLSTDWKLLSTFMFTFVLAIVICLSSLFLDRGRLTWIMLAVFWEVVLILQLFLYSYHRALKLINPSEQLRLLAQGARKGLRVWSRRARWVKFVHNQESGANGASPPKDSNHDVTRMIYFQSTPQWTRGAKQAVQHAMSFAQLYAKQGDHEVSDIALSAIVDINAAYIEAKGRTFQADTPIIDNPLSNDDFINYTLEHLRQNVQRGITSRDERQIIQTLRAMAKLVELYLGINYPNAHDEKSHAKLAAYYLAHAVQAVVPHDMVEVLLEGQRLMSRSTQHMLVAGYLNGIENLNDMIASVACEGCAKERYRPVTMEGMSHFARLTLHLLSHQGHDIYHAAKQVHSKVEFIVKLMLNVPDSPLRDIHRSVLGPYYSSTSVESLRVYLAGWANVISQAPPDSIEAKSAIPNLERWAEELHRTEGELLTVAIRKKSYFTYDMIEWIKGVTETLLAVANAPACDPNTREKLKQHALWLIATLDLIPDNEDTVRFIENFDLTETLLEAVLNARKRGCPDIAKAIAKQLLHWTLHKCGIRKVTQDAFKRGLYASAAIALKGDGGDVDALRSALRAWAQRDKSSYQKVLDGTAEEIRKYADELPIHEPHFSGIEREISESDPEALSALLDEIADIMSPATR